MLGIACTYFVCCAFLRSLTWTVGKFYLCLTFIYLTAVLCWYSLLWVPQMKIQIPNYNWKWFQFSEPMSIQGWISGKSGILILLLSIYFRTFLAKFVNILLLSENCFLVFSNTNCSIFFFLTASQKLSVWIDTVFLGEKKCF